MTGLLSGHRTVLCLRERGFTLSEVVVFVAVFMIVMLPSVKLSVESTRSYTGQIRITEEGARVGEAMTRLVTELRGAALSSLATTAQSVEFRRLTAVSGGLPVLGDTYRVELVPDPEDVADATDNDRNGLVDEHWLLLWQDLAPLGATPGEEDPTWVLCESVVPGGLVVTRQRALVTVELTYQMIHEPGSLPLQEVVSATVCLRN